MGYEFRRSHRLSSTAEIRSVLRDPNNNKYFGVIRATWRVNQRNEPRLAISIAKRHVRSAVRRHTLKRVIREWFRNAQSKLAAVDLVILSTKQMPDHSSEGDMKKQTRRALQRIERELSHVD